MRRVLKRKGGWWVLFGPLLTVVVLLVLLTVASSDLLSTVRAYVGGESFWSKGQKDAVYHLERYIATQDAAEYQHYIEALVVPLGDRRARLALDRDPPDLLEGREGLLQGGNHVDDVDGMVNGFLRFRHVSFMADAIQHWAEGDEYIAELEHLGQRVHARIQAGDSDTPALKALSVELLTVNQRLSEVERRYAQSLGEGSRTVHRLVRVVTLLLAVILTLCAVWATRALMREQSFIEHDLREVNDRWALAAEAAGLGLFDCDLRTQRTRVDARGAALYGLPARAVEVEVAALSQAHVHPDDAPRFRTAFGQAPAGRAPTTTRFRVRTDDGSERHVEAVTTLRDAPDGDDPSPVDAHHLVGTLRDVTSQVHAAQLRLDKEAAERASRAKTEFLSRVSHELRTPLNAVLGFAELLQSDTSQPLSATQGKRVQHVIDAGRHLLTLIDDILDLTHLDDSSAPLSLQPVGLLPSLLSSVQRLHSLARERHVVVDIDTSLARLSPLVMAESRRLGQVLTHVLSNAIKFNWPGGRVQVGCEDSAGEVCLKVCDSGPGLSAAQLSQLFQPFNRLGAEASKVPGRGLGLVVVQQLLARQGGRIEISSTEGEGTCVRLFLQGCEAPQAVAAT